MNLQPLEEGCRCQHAKALGQPLQLTQTVPGCPIEAHAADARRRIAASEQDPDIPTEDWAAHLELAELAELAEVADERNS